MLERSSRERFYEELENFLKGPEKEKTWNGIFIWNLKEISERLTKVAGLDVDVKNISILKLKITIKKTRNFYVVSGKYDIIVESNEFKVVSRYKRDGRYIQIPIKSFYNDPALTSEEQVVKKIQDQTAKAFKDEKVTCYLHNNCTRDMIRDIALYNKKEFHSCDCE